MKTTTWILMVPGVALAMSTLGCERAEDETRVGMLVPEGQEVPAEPVEDERRTGLTPGAPVPAAPLPGLGRQRAASAQALEQQEAEAQPETEPQLEAQAEGPEVEGQGPSATAQVTVFTVELDPEITRRCGGLDRAQIYFDFDSAKVQSDSKQRLDQVAQCLSEGPLKGEKLAVVGFADRRGPTDYNYDLGGRRAQSVVQYLSGKGLDDSRLTTLSMGELFAGPGDGQAPAVERRVAIRLEKNVFEDGESSSAGGQ